MENGAGEPGGYRAFLSYSHKDALQGARLHRRLESYRIPKHLVGHETVRGAVPARLAPIFRDREEFGAAESLTESVKAALAASESLIVLCSPHAKASRWVAKEIALFRALHPDRPVLAALIAGEPAEAFPDDLALLEPIAADFRKGRDGERLALLKLVAGMTALPLDALVQRDAQRQSRRVTAITGGSLTAVLVMALLLTFALRAQAEAERQRAEAEGLVEYMLTDLRDRLKGVGRLDVMTAVNARAMRYYRQQGQLSALPAGSLERRARVIVAMGQDDEALGHAAEAARKYREAHRVTAALLASAPRNPDRIYSHASNENRIGLILGNKGRFADAIGWHERALKRVKPLANMAGAKSDWIRLFSYASGNICAALVGLKRENPRALELCNDAVAASQVLLRRDGADRGARYDLVFHEMWLSEAYLRNNAPALAERAQLAALTQLDNLVGTEPANAFWKEQQMEVYLRHATLLRSQARTREAKHFLAMARQLNQVLTTTDPSNAYWRTIAKRIATASKEAG